MMTFSDVISFWFEELKPANWWKKDNDFDQLLRDKFSDLHEQASKCELFEWRVTPEGRLAEILVLDQFSRNMFRNTPKSFATDSLALALSQEAVSLGKDQGLTQVQRSFLYMPYMHSESLAIHDFALELYTKNGLQSNIDFEIKHRDIIVKYGRYPHRNKILNRPSTEEELVFLQQPGSGF